MIHSSDAVALLKRIQQLIAACPMKISDRALPDFPDFLENLNAVVQDTVDYLQSEPEEEQDDEPSVDEAGRVGPGSGPGGDHDPPDPAGE